jgi:hypothetical protein
MAWTKPQYAHHQVDNAGDVLIKPIPEGMDFLDYNYALEIINNWRSSHSCPLQSTKMMV